MNNNDNVPVNPVLPSEENEGNTYSENIPQPGHQTHTFNPAATIDTPLFRALNQLEKLSSARSPIFTSLAELNKSPVFQAINKQQTMLDAIKLPEVMNVVANSQASRIIDRINTFTHYYDRTFKSLARQAIPAMDALNRIARNYRIESRINYLFNSWPASPSGQRARQFAEQLQKINQRALPLDNIFRDVIQQGKLEPSQYELAFQYWEEAFSRLAQQAEDNAPLHRTEILSSYDNGGSSQEQPPTAGFLSLLSTQALVDGFKKLPVPLQAFICWFFYQVIVSMVEDSIKAAVLDGINEVKTEFTSPAKPKTLRKSTIVASHPDFNWEQLNHFRLITGTNVRLRLSPTMNSETVEMLNKGTVVAIMDTQGRQWLYVQVDVDGEKIYGWINRSYTSRLRN